MDKGGHPIYFGNPVDAIVYFKRLSSFANADYNLKYAASDASKFYGFLRSEYGGQLSENRWIP